ncbi:YgfZ/GcvT domain-containing protein [Synechocystis sp. PCC 7509]|uniref:CAF17-like 4Fe-4S cluster assembly/insertion protein YgfZ n=1 Tax=Synechocystis sp. PCC 7509 TaxID=927677 RepID=UPI0002AC5F5B|nr:folate-binding protein YgfZ [Synechocystis sp. PCC 7509]
MIQQLQDIQAAAGATFDSDIPVSFGNDSEALEAVQSGVAICDRTHWGVIEVTGGDRLRFLHNQSTNNFERLKSGEGCDTVFVTSTARTIDLVSAIVTDDSVLLITSPNRYKYLLELLDRYIFFADKVELTDITDKTAIFSLIGANSNDLVSKIGLEAIIGQPVGNHLLIDDVRTAVGSGLATPGYTLIVPAENAAKVWKSIVEADAVPMGDRVWEQLRIKQGRPVPDKELTDDYNPLEAGLLQTISFDKGCYIGQETIARLNTYKGVKQNLWGIKLNGVAEVGSVIMVGEEKVGKLTSIVESDRGFFGLGYIRTKAGGAGLIVQIGETTGEVVEVPFLSRVSL